MRLTLASRALRVARHTLPNCGLASLGSSSAPLAQPICNEVSAFRFSSTSSMHEPTLFTAAAASSDANEDQSDGKAASANFSTITVPQMHTSLYHVCFHYQIQMHYSALTFEQWERSSAMPFPTIMVLMS